MRVCEVTTAPRQSPSPCITQYNSSRKSKCIFPLTEGIFPLPQWNTYLCQKHKGPGTTSTTQRVPAPQPQGRSTSQCLEKRMPHIFHQQPCWLRKQVFICRTAAASNVSRRTGMTVMALKLLCLTNFTLCQGGDWKDRKQHQYALQIHFSGKESLPLPSVSPKYIKVMEIIL